MSKFKKNIIKNTFDKNKSQNKLIIRSNWEMKFVIFLNKNKQVKSWRNDYLFKYKDRESDSIKKYYIDFYVEMKSGEIFLIEIKPLSSLQERVKTRSQRYREIHTTNYLKNLSKFDSVQNFCKKTKNWYFFIAEFRNNQFDFYEWDSIEKTVKFLFSNQSK